MQPAEAPVSAGFFVVEKTQILQNSTELCKICAFSVLCNLSRQKIRIFHKQDKLDDVLNTQTLDEETARSLIFRLAQEQYEAIGNEEYETERLRRLFTAFECTAELNAELLQSTVSAVLVTRQTVRLQLKNGQTIGKDDLV